MSSQEVPSGFELNEETPTADGQPLYEAPSAYIAGGSHGVTPTWTEDGGTLYFLDAALRPLTGEQLDELIRCLTNVRQATTEAEDAPERIGAILGRVVEDLRFRAATQSMNESRAGAPVG